MTRRKSLRTNVNTDRWLVSYADFVTLLFGFFVVMYSVSHVSEEKYKTLSDTLSSVFSDQNIQHASEEDSANDSIRTADINTLAEQFQSELEQFMVEGELSISANENWIELSLNSELLFASGSADPSQEAKTVFSELADMLSRYDNEIQIQGHTDNIPISTDSFKNNWELSSARAVSMVNFLSFNGVNPDQMSAVAFGEYRPIADNQLEEGRKKNRRVVIRISNQAIVKTKQDASDIFPPSEVKDKLELNLDSQSSAITGLNARPNTQRNPSKPGDPEAIPAVQPLRLKGGDLLFTSDPNLPRIRELESADSDN